MDVEMVNNLKFNRIDYRKATGKLYAFVTCIDIGSSGKGTEEKRYWGEVSKAKSEAVEINRIMAHGAKWDQLPS